MNPAVDMPIPEDLLKKKKRSLEREKARVHGVAKRRSDGSTPSKKAQEFKRASQYARDYKERQEGLQYQREIVLSTGNFFFEPEAKLLFVVRIRGSRALHPKTKKALLLLRLKRANSGVFVRLNKATLNMLKFVEPYVAWGYPSLDTVRNLVYKRGKGNVNGDRIALTSNKIIEDTLQEKNIICMEDLVHEIYTVGPAFKEANNFFWPFELSAPRGGFKSIGKHFIQGGDFGNREDFINDLVARML